MTARGILRCPSAYYQPVGLRVAVLGLLAAALAAGSAEAGITSRTLVAGKVMLDPAYPVCRVGHPCARPLPGFRLVFSRRGVVAARARTDTRGRYTVRLAPGDYAVSAPAHRAGRGLSPRRIHVPAVPRAVRNFTYDAGIR